MFELDNRLAATSIFIADLTVCQVRLVNDSQYPWLLLVPMRPDIRDIIDLSPADQAVVWQESALVSQMLQALHNPDKLNVATLGNVVAQCHIHHIARWRTDAAWPDPIWGKFPAVEYESSVGSDRVKGYYDYLHQAGALDV